jgi:LSD1 subclass zinc finger protein
MSKRKGLSELIAREVIRDPDGSSLVVGRCSCCQAITVGMFDRRRRLCAAFELDGAEARLVAAMLLEQAAGDGVN